MTPSPSQQCSCRAAIAPIDRFGTYECPVHGYYAQAEQIRELAAEVERLREALYPACVEVYDLRHDYPTDLDDGADYRAAMDRLGQALEECDRVISGAAALQQNHQPEEGTR